MAWIVPAITAVYGAVNSSNQTANANKNNASQQQAQQNNAASATQRAQNTIAPWLQQGASPYGNANSPPTNAVKPLGLAGSIPQANAQQVMQPPPQAPPQGQQRQVQPVARQGQPATAPAPGGGPAATVGQIPAQPAQGQPPQLTPQQMAVLQRVLAQRGGGGMGGGTLNTAPVALG